MTRGGLRSLLICGLLLMAGLRPGSGAGRGEHPALDPGRSRTPAALEREFFAAIREGDTKKFLSYVPEQGMNVGPRAVHVSRAAIEQQFAQHRDLYCKLFDSSCIQIAIKLDASTLPAPTVSC